MGTEWIPIRKTSPLPPEGAVVDVLYADGVVCRAKRTGSLFIMEDSGTYRYVDPAFWRNTD